MQGRVFELPACTLGLAPLLTVALHTPTVVSLCQAFLVRWDSSSLENVAEPKSAVLPPGFRGGTANTEVVRECGFDQSGRAAFIPPPWDASRTAHRYQLTRPGSGARPERQSTATSIVVPVKCEGEIVARHQTCRAPETSRGSHLRIHLNNGHHRYQVVVSARKIYFNQGSEGPMEGSRGLTSCVASYCNTTTRAYAMKRTIRSPRASH
jgi:hypothetical protein